ncbi:MAG TPA: TlpA disulfide reductase family protein [Terriglobia bacterium]|nr:TlpA disulfide reductase family protein [Terriglobia bacterium]
MKGPGVLRCILPLMLAGVFALTPATGHSQHAPAAQASDAETRVLDYIRDHLRPGRPLLISELYSNVFTQPAERQALDKLYNAFFRIPLFLAEYQQKFGAPPPLRTIAQQFDLKTPGAADILLRVMEADPRVPRFLTRDPKTGEITHVDVEMIRSDPHFAHAVTMHLSGWEGRPAPDFKLSALDGREVDSAALRNKVVLLYVWFTGCPPCMKEAPSLVRLQGELGGRGFAIVGANADRVLGLGYGDDVRRRYARDEHVNFPIVGWTKESDAAYGRIAVFPTLFLISGKGVIIHHWVGYVRPEELRQAVLGALTGP